MDTSYINEIKEIGGKEAKEMLAEYAKETFDITLKKTKSFDNMVKDLENELTVLASEPLPEENTGLSMKDILSMELENDEQTTEPEIEKPIENEPKEELLIDSPIQEQIEIVEIEPIQEEIIEQPKSKFEDNYSPSLAMLGSSTNSYCAIQYWVYDWIVANPNWKNEPEKCTLHDALPILKSLIYYINRNGSVKIRESRNSQFHILT